MIKSLPNEFPAVILQEGWVVYLEEPHYESSPTLLPEYETPFDWFRYEVRAFWPAPQPPDPSPIPF